MSYILSSSLGRALMPFNLFIGVSLLFLKSTTHAPIFVTSDNQNYKVDAHTNTNTWHTLHTIKMTMKGKGKGKQKLITTSVHNKSTIVRITNIKVTSALIKY